MQGFKLLALALVISFSLDAKKPPNFVLVYMDDLGWAETSVEMIKGRADTRMILIKPPTLKDWLVKAWSCRPVTLHPRYVRHPGTVCSMG